MIRLIATDLDGTLLEKGGALPEGFYDVAEELKKLGILLVAASGRQYDNLRRKFQPIAREMGFVCENGGLNAVGREIVSIHPMDRAAALGITQTLQGLGLSILLSGVRCCYTLASDRPFCDGMVYTLRNVGRLLVQRGQHRAGVAVKAVLASRVADFAHRVAHQLLVIDTCRRGNLTHQNHQTGCGGSFASDTALRILSKQCIQNRVRNLVADFIRMSLGHGLRSE